MLCACPSRRRNGRHTILVEMDFDPSTLRIQTPRRKRWVAHSEEDIKYTAARVERRLDSIERAAEIADEEIEIFLQAMRILLAQPATLAARVELRNTIIHKVDELNKIVLSTESEHEDSFVEMAYAFGDLLSEIHDHPLYKDE